MLFDFRMLIHCHHRPSELVMSMVTRGQGSREDRRGALVLALSQFLFLMGLTNPALVLPELSGLRS